MFSKIGEVCIITNTSSNYKREANILSRYSAIFTELIKVISPIITDILGEGAYISQFTQHTLRQGEGRIIFHRDPPHHIIGYKKAEVVKGLQFCVMLTDFTIDNGCTVFCEECEEYEESRITSHMIGKKGDICWWSCNVLHSEGINNTCEDRSCLILTVQSSDAPDSNFYLGDDKPVIPIEEQYVHIEPVNGLIIKNKKLVFTI